MNTLEREIEFRGKAKNRENTWFFGDLRVSKGKCWIFPRDEEPAIDKHRVIPKTVGQYTGLLDCEGNEIYEGDIIRVKGNTFDKGFGVVMFHKDGYFYIDDSFGKFQRDKCKPIGDFVEDISRNFGVEIYVNGNVHDNTELIKKEE